MPKSRVASSATCWRCSALVPGPARVALVPMHCSAAGADRAAQPADQHRDVGALPAAVGVQLVEDQEATGSSALAISADRSRGRVSISSSIT